MTGFIDKFPVEVWYGIAAVVVLVALRVIYATTKLWLRLVGIFIIIGGIALYMKGYRIH